MGVYVQNELCYSLSSTKQASLALTTLFGYVAKWIACRNYTLRTLYYATGPGSFTAMKLVHVFVHTLAITQNLKLYGALGFVFNAYQPIRAFGKSYYVYHQGTICLSPLESPKVQTMQLPVLLKPNLFDADPKPLYLLPPV